MKNVIEVKQKLLEISKERDRLVKVNRSSNTIWFLNGQINILQWVIRNHRDNTNQLNHRIHKKEAEESDE